MSTEGCPQKQGISRLGKGALTLVGASHLLRFGSGILDLAEVVQQEGLLLVEEVINLLQDRV